MPRKRPGLIPGRASISQLKDTIIRNSQEFIVDIEKIVKSNKVNYLDALMIYIEKHNVDPELVASIVRKNPNLKGKLREDCMNLNLVEKIKTIPGM